MSMNENHVSLLITVPVCSFRKGYAREYLETELIPPPSTIYGFLLALIGETDRYVYNHSYIAYAITSMPELSTLIRTTWRIKKKKEPQGQKENRSPDYQQILSQLELVIWIREGPLADKVQAGKDFSTINRFGGLSLGESKDLVNDVIWFPKIDQLKGHWVLPQPNGNLSLPIWVDHVGSKDTIWQQFQLHYDHLEPLSFNDHRWIDIHH